MKAPTIVLLAALLLGLAGCGKSSTPAAREGNAPLKITAPLGLPEIALPADAPLTESRVALGRKLFFDRRLSPNDTMSCAMCHVPEQGFTVNELGTAVGLEGRTVRRNSPTLYNIAYHPRLFHDGREFSLENQVWGPLLAHNEMGNAAIGLVVEKVRSLQDYTGRFEATFDGRPADVVTIGLALAAYQRTLVSGNSPFDRWRFGGDANALSPEARRGFELFTGSAGCSTCHTLGDKTALFSDFRYHNTGIGWKRAMDRPERHDVTYAPGARTALPRAQVESFSEPEASDVGRFEITLDSADRWAYKTPMLRNVALSAPYMHDGSLATLDDVVAFYERGGIDNEDKSPLLKPLTLSKEDRRALVAFLQSLTGDNIERVVAEARAEPVGQ